MKLVIIEGQTSTGKTTLARKLAKDLNLPLFIRDDYKERHFDLLGDNLTYKRMYKIEKDSWQELYNEIQKAVKNNTSLIVEANFVHSHRYKIKKLLAVDTVVIEIFCHAKGRTILKRYINRNRKGERHSGHKDHLWYLLVALEATFSPLIYYTRPLRLSKKPLRVNSDDFYSIDYAGVLDFVETT